MAETRFIRTVVFGGYDKGDVDKKLDYLYDLFFDSKNKLREAKLLLDRMKDGMDEKNALDSVLAAERAKLTELQVKNENLIEKTRSLDDELSRRTQELEEVKAKLAETQTQLTEAQAKLASEGGANSGAMLNVVFQQAQSSATLIVSTAQKQADDLESDSKKLAENTVTDANNKAKMIIYEAEKKAAEITAAAEAKSAAMDVASGNVKAAVLADVEKISAELAKFRAVFEQFKENGTQMLSQSEELLSGVSADVTSGGIPVFREPVNVDADMDMLERPSLDDIDDNYLTGNDIDMAEEPEAEKPNDALQKLREKAAALSGAPGAEEKPAGGRKMTLEELARKAKSLK